MSLVDETNRKKKASHEGGNSDKYDTGSRNSRMASSGKKIKSDDLVDRST